MTAFENLHNYQINEKIFSENKDGRVVSWKITIA
jgi:hypothetical protein